MWLVLFKIDIERASDRVKIIIFTAKPGIVIGKGGAEIEKLKGELAPYVNGKKVFVDTPALYNFFFKNFLIL